jgi:hypothetical protein
MPENRSTLLLALQEHHVSENCLDRSKGNQIGDGMSTFSLVRRQPVASENRISVTQLIGVIGRAGDAERE